MRQIQKMIVKEVSWIFTNSNGSQCPKIYVVDYSGYDAKWYNDEGSAILMDGIEYNCYSPNRFVDCVSIHHYVDLGYFHIQFGTSSKDISPDGYDVSLYEYK